MREVQPRWKRFHIVFYLGILVATTAAVLTQTQVPSTIQDFQQPGTQPETMQDILLGAEQLCAFCHGEYDEPTAPYNSWRTSMMAQAARDPLFHGALAIANQDANFSGEFCLRCHSPKAWLEGRSTPPSGAALNDADFEGVGCHVCHRMIDPIYAPTNPPDDIDELAAIGIIPTVPQNGQYIVDRFDRRRGPFQLNEPFLYHEYRISPFHQESLLCATCHDVSNPLYLRQGGPKPRPTDTYVATAMDTPHPTQYKFDEFPIERTYSEWSQSSFARAPIDMHGRFGGNKRLVSTCQDCHMPDASGVACNPFLDPVYRDDLPVHSFNGAANWVLDAILNLDATGELHPNYVPSGLTQDDVNAAKAGNKKMLQAAADLHIKPNGESLLVRVTNQTGHKLPTGYPEGRRMWINVKYYTKDFLTTNHLERPFVEYGAYNFNTGVLNTLDTKVYEAKLGLDSHAAQLTGLPFGESFHFALNNKWFKDNRIPPRGFTNAGFASIQASPFAYSYADGQYWDETKYPIPCKARFALVTLYYQTSSKEYIDFLRTQNTTNNVGQIVTDQWNATGKGAPVIMAQAKLIFPDCNNNGTNDGCDIAHGISQDVNHNGIPDECE